MLDEPLMSRYQLDELMKEGVTSQWAQMCEDWVISLSVSQWLPGGMRTHGDSECAPGDLEYEELKKIHKLEKPGDSSNLIKKLVDGKWVIETGP